jgi:hypothetical protein
VDLVSILGDSIRTTGKAVEARPAVGIGEVAMASAWVLLRLMPRTCKVVDMDLAVTLAVSYARSKLEHWVFLTTWQNQHQRARHSKAVFRSWVACVKTLGST